MEIDWTLILLLTSKNLVYMNWNSGDKEKIDLSRSNYHKYCFLRKICKIQIYREAFCGEILWILQIYALDKNAKNKANRSNFHKTLSNEELGCWRPIVSFGKQWYLIAVGSETVTRFQSCCTLYLLHVFDIDNVLSNTTLGPGRR